MARLVDSQDLFAASLGEQPTPGFTVFDARGYWQARENLLFTAGVENIADRFYQEHLDLRTGGACSSPVSTSMLACGSIIEFASKWDSFHRVGTNPHQRNHWEVHDLGM